MTNAIYTTGAITVGTEATLICTGDGRLIQNTGDVTAFLGGPDVTASAGYQLAAGDSITIPPSTGAPRDLYAIVQTGTTTVGYLQQ